MYGTLLVLPLLPALQQHGNVDGGDGERPVAGRFFSPSPSPRSKKGTTRNHRWDGGVDKEELGGEECSSPTRVRLHRTGDCSLFILHMHA